MKLKTLKYLVLPLLAIVTACDHQHNPGEGNATEETVTELKIDSTAIKLGLEEGVIVLNNSLPLPDSLVLGIAPKGTTLKWTAFKTNDKIAVGGTFNEFTITSVKEGKDLATSFVGATILIPVKGINSTNPERDEKIVRTFFGTMLNTENITGKIVSIANDNAVIEFTLNKITKPIKTTYVINQGVLTIKGVLDLANWNGLNAITALNTECNDLHKGADGISKLWPNVDVEISVTLTQK